MVYESRFKNIVDSLAQSSHYHYVGSETTNVAVIVKELIEDAEPELVEAFVTEAKAMITIDNDNVIRMVGCLLDGNLKKIVYEEYTNGPLKKFLESARKDDGNKEDGIKPIDQIKMARDVAAGMLYLSERQVVHGDLASRSCLVNKFKRVCVGDYGLNRQTFTSEYQKVGKQKLVLPARWMAPESLAEETQYTFNHATDVWSFGVTAWEICTFGNLPFSKVSSSQVAKEILKGTRLAAPKTAADLFLGCKGCFESSAEDRPSFAALHATLEELVTANTTRRASVLAGGSDGESAAERRASTKSTLSTMSEASAADPFAKKKKGMRSFRALGAFKDAENPGDALNEATGGGAANITEIARDRIKTTKELGQGAFGLVMLGELAQEDGTVVPCACKTLKSQNPDDFDALVAEAMLVAQFDHENVVRCYGQITTGEPAMIVLEFMKLGSLFGYLEDLEKIPELKELMQMAIDIANGMQYLAGRNQVHRDLAARNILVSDSGACKISDFGLSRDLDENMYYESEGGMVPIRWTPPEAYKFKKYSTMSDVWSYGITLYEIWTKSALPYGRKWTNMNVMMQVESGFRLPPPANCPKAVYKIMLQCWNPSRKGRPTFASIHERLTTAFDFLFADEGATVVAAPAPDEDMGKMQEIYMGVACPTEENLDEDTYFMPTAFDDAPEASALKNELNGLLAPSKAPPSPKPPPANSGIAAKANALYSADKYSGKYVESSPKKDRFSKEYLSPASKLNTLDNSGNKSPGMQRSSNDGHRNSLRKQQVRQEAQAATDGEAKVHNVKDVVAKSQSLQQTAAVEEAGLSKLGVQGPKREFVETVGRAVDVSDTVPQQRGKRNKCVCRRFKCVCDFNK